MTELQSEKSFQKLDTDFKNKCRDWKHYHAERGNDINF